MKALVVGSGNSPSHKLLKERYAWADLVIAADGGALYLAESNLIPHVLLGDFDSISGPVLEKMQQQSEVISFPTHKDYTDMELAINLAVERGAKELVLLGACGSRLDHTMGNVFLLHSLLEKDIQACVEDDHNQIYLIKDALTIKKQENRKVSLLPLSPRVEGLTTKGLAYPLCEDTLKIGINRGISNEFNDDFATISIKKGLLLVFLSED